MVSPPVGDAISADRVWQVTAALTGSLLATILFIPGICMVIGGLKFKEQRYSQCKIHLLISLDSISVLLASPHLSFLFL